MLGLFNAGGSDWRLMMKHTGTIEIDCGEKTCDGCNHTSTDVCLEFNRRLSLNRKNKLLRCQQCLETFKPVAEENTNASITNA